MKGYCEIDPELVLPQVRQNIERSCEMIAKGKVDFARVTSHVLQIFKDKFNYFKMSIGVMEKLLTIMSMSENPNANKELLLSYKIKAKHESSEEAINFCIRCFKGYFVLQYHPKKKWGIKCEQCNFRVGLLEGAGSILRQREQCQECMSHLVTA